MAFPAPVGGVGLPFDLAPSIIFAVLYGLLLPLVIYRFWDRRSRTYAIGGTTLFAVERIVAFSFRAVQSQRLSWRVSRRLAIYHQYSFGLGFVGLAGDMIGLLQCLLVHPTYGYDRYPESCAAATRDCALQPPAEGEEDQQLARATLRLFSYFTGLAFLASIVPGIIGNWSYANAILGDEAAVQKVFNFRYASCAVALFLTMIIMTAATWSLHRQRRPGKQGVIIICSMATLVGIVATYRLGVMYRYTDALDSTTVGSLNTPVAKAGFYILHILPEWISTAIMLGFNIRKTFGTGPWGDPGREETPKQREKREKKAAEREARKRTQLEQGNDSTIPLVARGVV